MKAVNIYIRCAIALMLAIFGWGVLAPELVSASTYPGFWPGIFVVLAVPVVIYYLIKPIFKTKNNER